MLDAKHLSKSMQHFCTALPTRFQWTPHNLWAHPLSELLFQLGYEDEGNWVHEATIPIHERGTGLG